MSKTTGLSLDELKAKRKDLMSQGKELSTSKELGKIEQAIKIASPSGYSKEQVSSAQQNLKLINQPIVSGSTGTAMSGTTPSGLKPTTTSEVSALEKQLSDKQAALIKATQNVNDNPWYSEATRVGKLAKLNNIAQLEISNINAQLAQKKQDEATARKAITDVESAKLARLRTVTDDAGNVTVYDMVTGKVTSTIKGVGKAEKPDKTTPKVTDKDVANALTFVKEQDAIKDGSLDKLLSSDEIRSAVDNLAEQVGNYDLAKQLVLEAMNRFGYSEWTGGQ